MTSLKMFLFTLILTITTASTRDVCTLGAMTAGGIGDRSAELDRKYFKFNDQTAYDDYASAGSQYWHNGLGRTTYVSQTSSWPEGCMNACCANSACQSFMFYKSECILYSVATSAGMDPILGHDSRQGPWGKNTGGPGYSLAFWEMSRKPECTNNCVSTPGWTIDSNPVTTCGWMEHICGPMRRGECLEHGGNVKCQWGYVTGNHWANYGPYGSPVSHCCNCKGFQMPENYADGYWTTAPASWVWNGNWKNTHTSTGTELPICEPTNAPTETPTSSPVELDTLPDLKFYLKVEDYTSGNAWVDRVSNIEVHVPGSASFHEGYVHLSGTAITAPLQTNPNVMQSATYVIRLRVPTIPSNLGWVMSQFPDFGWSRALTISDDRLGHVWQTPGHFQSGLGSFPTDTWQVLVGTWTQGGACQTFLQGTSGNPRTCSNGAGTVSNEKLIIGGRGETDAHNPGSIDISDVLVFNRILNTDEINFITSTLSEPKTLPGTQVHDAL
eukprot:UN21010